MEGLIVFGVFWGLLLIISIYNEWKDKPYYESQKRLSEIKKNEEFFRTDRITQLIKKKESSSFLPEIQWLNLKIEWLKLLGEKFTNRNYVHYIIPRKLSTKNNSHISFAKKIILEFIETMQGLQNNEISSKSLKHPKKTIVECSKTLLKYFSDQPFSSTFPLTFDLKLTLKNVPLIISKIDSHQTSIDPIDKFYNNIYDHFDYLNFRLIYATDIIEIHNINARLSWLQTVNSFYDHNSEYSQYQFPNPFNFEKENNIHCRYASIIIDDFIQVMNIQSNSYYRPISDLKHSKKLIKRSTNFLNEIMNEDSFCRAIVYYELKDFLTNKDFTKGFRTELKRFIDLKELNISNVELKNIPKGSF